MGLFAWITGALAIRYPGSDGLVGAVRVAFGMPLRNLCAWFLTIAVCFARRRCSARRSAISHRSSRAFREPRE